METNLIYFRMKSEKSFYFEQEYKNTSMYALCAQLKLQFSII